MSMTLAFEGARYDPPGVMLGVVATIRCRVASELIFSEEEFPIVELRHMLARWDRLRGNFSFTSVESEDDGLVWFEQQDSGLWKVGSVWQRHAAPIDIEGDVLKRATEEYIHAVDDWLAEHLNVAGKDVQD